MFINTTSTLSDWFVRILQTSAAFSPSDLETRAPWTIPTLGSGGGRARAIYPWQTHLIPEAHNESMCNVVVMMTYHGPNVSYTDWGGWPVLWFNHDFSGIPRVDYTNVWKANTSVQLFDLPISAQVLMPKYTDFFSGYDDDGLLRSGGNDATDYYSRIPWTARDLPALVFNPKQTTERSHTGNWTFVIGGPQRIVPGMRSISSGRCIYAHTAFRCSKD